jgi:hypothetical protein
VLLLGKPRLVDFLWWTGTTAAVPYPSEFKDVWPGLGAQP